MTPRLQKIVLAWLAVLTVLLLVSLAGNAALIQAANDSPVHVYSASTNDHGAGGSSTTTDDTITGTTPDTLVSITTGNLSAAHNHTCVVTASAAAKYNQNGLWVFGLNMDTTASTIAATDRRIEMNDNAGINDDSYEEVSTTYAFSNVSGSHTFYFSARKNSAGSGNLTVDASSITVVCIKKTLQASGGEPDFSGD